MAETASPASFVTIHPVQQWEGHTGNAVHLRVVAVAAVLGISVQELLAHCGQKVCESNGKVTLETALLSLGDALANTSPNRHEVAVSLLTGYARNPLNREFIPPILLVLSH